jgi:hypothetical protein
MVLSWLVEVAEFPGVFGRWKIDSFIPLSGLIVDSIG